MSTYTTNMPMVGQDISVTQPLIEANFNVINSWVNQDHTPLNGLPGETPGTHQVIHSEEVDSDPVTTSSQLAFYNKLDVDSINRYFMREPNSGAVRQLTGLVTIAGSAFSGSTPPSYVAQTMILGGIMVMCGNAVVSTAGTAITFPNGGFETNCFGVVISVNQNGAATQSIVTDSFPTLTGFTARINGPGSVNCFWIALGN